MKYTLFAEVGMLCREDGTPVAAFCRRVDSDEMRRIAIAPSREEEQEETIRQQAAEITELKRQLALEREIWAGKEREYLRYQTELRQDLGELRAQSENLRLLAQRQGERLACGRI